MTLLKSFTMKWWQAGVFKLGMLALGVSIGAHWHEFFSGYVAPMLVVAAVVLAYISFVWWKQ